MGDNSYSARPPWPGQGHAAYEYQQAALASNIRAPIDPRLAMQQQIRASTAAMNPAMTPAGMNGTMNPTVNGYPGMQATMSTPMSASGTYPMWDIDVPSQMFLQAVNFDRLMAERQAGIAQLANSSRVPDETPAQNTNDTGQNVVEQQQAVEQARLLQRFKELRNWQQQQQEMLMSQQHQQLSLLRKEQERMQTIISHQRGTGQGAANVNTVGDMETPPRRHIPPGTDISHLLAPTSQSQRQQVAAPGNTLPKPVMYVEPSEGDDDEIKTNPDLFSDTNSNRGSQATIDDGMFPIPDSASEASADVGGYHQPVQYRQRFNKHELDAPKKHHRSFAELEADTEFQNLSSQSPTLLDMQHSIQSRPNESRISEEGEEHGGNEQQDDVDTDDDSYEDVSDDHDDESDDQEDTQIEVGKPSLDEMPIKPGIEGGKTFEQLLEEQLQAEQERLCQASIPEDSPVQTKRSFLKKGQGIARFDKPGKKPVRSKKSAGTQAKSSKVTSKPHASKAAANPKSTTLSGKLKPDTGQKSNASGAKTLKLEKDKKTNAPGNATKHNDKTKIPDKTTKASTEPPNRATSGGEQKITSKKAESIADDASFIASIQERQIESERDLEDLDEFEILEQFADDNMSFCSNSSIVTKGLRGLQSDRILPGPGAMSHSTVRPTSPRAALIKKLEQLKHVKNTGPDKLHLIRHSNKQQHAVKHQQHDPGKHEGLFKGAASSSSNSSKEETMSRNAANQLKGGGDGYRHEDRDDEEGGSESDDSMERIAKKSSHLLLNSKGGVGDLYGKLNSKSNARTDFHQFPSIGTSVPGISGPMDSEHARTEANGLSKNELLLCSTEKKLERVLSYTAITEASGSQASESEHDLEESDSDSSDESDSDDDSDEDFVINESPSKVLTRKIAGKPHVTSSNPSSNPINTLDYLSTDYTTSSSLGVGGLGKGNSTGAFISSSSKSPNVISKERISVLDMLKEENSKFSYHSDSDSVGNRKNNSSFSDDDADHKTSGKSSVKSAGENSYGEKRTLQFDDNDEWGEDTPKGFKSRNRLSSSENEHDKTLVDDAGVLDKASGNLESSDVNKGTPPTSKLVSKLFPQLKPQHVKLEEQQLEKVTAASQVSTGDGVQSKILRDKLVELEREIEKFRNENSHLSKLRTDREEALTKLKKEVAEFEREKIEELKRIEEFRNEEAKKLKHERKMFDKYQKAARAVPDKKEREEIETLKMQLTELQEEMKRKESRWTSSSGRLRDKIEHLEQENEELKEEVKLLERKRLEWMQKDDKNKARSVRSSTPTEDMYMNHVAHLTNGIADHQPVEHMNDLSSVSSVRSGTSSNNKSQPFHSKTNIRSSHPPSTNSHHQSTHQNTHAQSNHTHKPLNTNQSARAGAHSQQKGNQSHSNKITHNSKPVPASAAHRQGAHGHNSGKSGGTKAGRSGNSAGKVDSKAGGIRGSQEEDLPRRELGTTAAPQDVSMYSETDVNMQATSNIPRKFASSKYGVDRSVIDKGDNKVYDELQHSDGKVERTYHSGAREILFSNGTKKEISSDGKSVIVSFFNGDIKQIMPDQRVIYYYAENQTTHTNYPDGLEIIQFPNEQTEKLYPDGTKEITFPDQTVKYIFQNGSEESIFADGTVIRLEKNGDKTMEFPNGQREIHTREYKKREYPDGTVKTVYPDGRQETRYSNGRLRVKDKDGNVVVDRLC